MMILKKQAENYYRKKVWNATKRIYVMRNMLSKTFLSLELQNITAGDELYALIQNSGDVSEFSKELSSLQLERLHEYIQRRNEEKAAKMSQWISEQSLVI